MTLWPGSARLPSGSSCPGGGLTPPSGRPERLPPMQQHRLAVADLLPAPGVPRAGRDHFAEYLEAAGARTPLVTADRGNLAEKRHSRDQGMLTVPLQLCPAAPTMGRVRGLGN